MDKSIDFIWFLDGSNGWWKSDIGELNGWEIGMDLKCKIARGPIEGDRLCTNLLL